MVKGKHECMEEADTEESGKTVKVLWRGQM